MTTIGAGDPTLKGAPDVPETGTSNTPLRADWGRRPCVSATGYRNIVRMNSLAVVTRFAPSPTGELHLRNIRTALLSLLLARAEGGLYYALTRTTAKHVLALEHD